MILRLLTSGAIDLELSMNSVSRCLLALLFLVLAVIYAIPNIALLFGVFLTVYSNYVSLLFCFMFAYQIATLVESLYRKYEDKED